MTLNMEMTIAMTQQMIMMIDKQMTTKKYNQMTMTKERMTQMMEKTTK